MLTLDAAGRPMYGKSGKSASAVRAGRVLKEATQQSAKGVLPSIKGSDAPPGRRDSNYGAQNLSPDLQMKRIMELERENTKLRADYSQAEKSIKNYRKLISHQQSEASEESTNTIMTQTEGPAVSDLEKALAKSEIARQDLVKTDKERELKMNDLQAKVESLERDLATRTSNGSSEVETLKERDVAAKKTILELEARTGDSEAAIIVLNSQLTALKASLDKADALLATKKEMVAAMVNTNCATVRRARQAFDADGSEIKKSLSDFGSFLAKASGDLKAACEAKEDASCKASHVNSERDKLRQDLLDSAQRFAQESSEYMSKVKVLETQVETLRAEAQQERTRADATQKRYLEAEALGEESAARVHAAEKSEKAASAEVTRLSEEAAMLRKKVAELTHAVAASSETTRQASAVHDERQGAVRELAESMLKSFTDMWSCVSGSAEAVKKLAHVKDMQRVGQLDELKLERDKLFGEVKFMREVINVYKSGLKMAESSLEELQPHVVEKLMQARNNQLKLLSRGQQASKNDLEARSKEMASMQGKVLKELVKKNTAKEADMTAKSKAAMDVIKEELSQLQKLAK